MKNVLIYILIITALFFKGAVTVCAQEISEPSAKLISEQGKTAFDFRVENLRNFFDKYNSPLAKYSEEFVTYADKNNLDYRLIPAITGVESTFGKNIPINSYNAYGWANGEYSFDSWEDSIAHVSETLKISYIEKGAPTISKIARRYAPPSTTWGSKVKFFISKIDSLPLNFDII